MSVKFFPHTADVEFEVSEESLEGVFEQAASTMFNVMTDTKKVNPSVKKTIEVDSEDKESLMYDFLEKLLILHDSENLMFSRFEVKKIESKGKKIRLEASAEGEEFDDKRHENKVVVKAITYNSMKIGKKDGKYFAHIVLDI